MHIWLLGELQRDWTFAIMEVLIIVFSICFHEYMHARAALWRGDDTAARLGHLSLDPLKQMGVVSLVLLAVIGIAFGRVPVNPARLRGKYDEAIVSFAGPFANIILTLVFCVAFAVVWHFRLANGNFVFNVLYFGAVINAALFLLNMIPIPPLDGHGVAKTFFPALRNTSSEFLNGATFFLFIVLVFSARFLFLAADYVTTVLLTLLGVQFGAGV